MTFTNASLAFEDLPAIEEAVFNPHPSRYLGLRMMNLGIVLILTFFVWFVLLIFGNQTFAIIIMALWALAGITGFVEEIKGFDVRGYALREHDISYRKGFLWFNITTVPFNRIQHCEIAQGPVAKAFNLSTLSIYTAGGAASDIRIGGLEPGTAKRLREYIAKVSSSYE